MVVYLLTGGEWPLPADSALAGYTALTVLLGVMALVCGRWLSVSGARGRLDIFELPVWYTWWTSISIVPFGLLAFTDAAKYQLDVPVTGEAAAVGLVLPLVGLVGLWLGYCLTRLALGRTSVDAVASPWRPLRAVVVAVYGLIALERVWRIQTVGAAFASTTALEELSGLNQWSIYCEESVYLVVAVTALQVFRRQWQARYLVCVVACELTFALIAGSTKPLLWLGVVLFGAWQYSGRSVRVRSLWKWGLLLLVALVAVPVVEQYRGLIALKAFDAHSPTGAAQAVLSSIQDSWGTDPGGATQVLLDKLTVRQALVAQTLGLVVSETPSVIPFWGSERLFAIPIDVLPRILWPDKPILNTGVYFAVNYLGAPRDTTSSAAFTIFGDLYVSAGWGATVAGMLVLGAVSAVLYQALKSVPLRRADYNVPALYIALAVGMMDVEGSYIGVMVGLIQRFVVYTAIFWLLHFPRRVPLGVSRLPGVSSCA